MVVDLEIKKFRKINTGTNIVKGICLWIMGNSFDKIQYRSGSPYYYNFLTCFDYRMNIVFKILFFSMTIITHQGTMTMTMILFS